MSKPTITPSNVYIFGQSLGGVNAIVAIAKNDFPEIRAIAIEGAFYSYRTEAQDMMGSTVQKKIGKIPCLSLQIWLISFFSVTNFYSPDEYIDQVSPIPILLIHCAQDYLVSHHHSEWLYKKAREPKYLWIISGCNHLQVFTNKKTGYRYRQRLVQFFNDHRQNMKWEIRDMLVALFQLNWIKKDSKKKTRGQRLSLFTQTYDSESVDWSQNSTLFLFVQLYKILGWWYLVKNLWFLCRIDRPSKLMISDYGIWIFTIFNITQWISCSAFCSGE